MQTKPNTCVDCGRAIWPGFARCKPCALRKRHAERQDSFTAETLRALYMVEDRGFRNPCWIWKGSPDKLGYCRITFRGKRQMAHRFAYEFLIGPFPEGLEPDHLCRNRSCVNPDHIEPVTHAVNMARSLNPNNIAHETRICRRGHPQTAETSYVSRRGETICRICRNARSRRFRANHAGHSSDSVPSTGILEPSELTQ